MYPIVLEPDDDGSILVTCPDLPEVTTFGDDREDALRHAADAIEEALAARIARQEDIPAASPRKDHPLAGLSPLAEAKVALYRAIRKSNLSKEDIARRLGQQPHELDRLVDLGRRTQIEQIDRALRAMGKRLVVSVEDAA